MQTPPQAPPGWYTDPGDQRGWRWWNGWEWTPYTSPGWPAYASMERPEPARAREGRLEPWAKASVIVVAAATAASGANDLALAGRWRAYFHDLRIQFDAIGHRPPPRVPQLPHWGELTLPFLLASMVLFLVWQHAAATTARRLRYPARRSPAFGVGSYFIPIVWFWFPYQALRDCLPPGHPGRRVVLWYWILKWAVGVVNVSAPILLAEVEPVGIVAVAAGFAFTAFGAACGYRMIADISAAHAATLAGS